MLIVETYTAESSIPGAGFGLFAADDIAKGQSVTRVSEGKGADQFRDDDFVRTLSREELYRYAFHAYRMDEATGLWILNTDNERFTNHSTTPNIVTPEDAQRGVGDHPEEVALTDIPKGTEIVSDYGQFDTVAFHKLGGLGLLGAKRVPQITNLLDGPDKWIFHHAPESSRLDA